MRVQIMPKSDICFGDIPIGECFVFGGEYYMRIIDGDGVKFDDDECAVNLATGRSMAFGAKVEVNTIRLKAVLEVDHETD